MLYNNNPDAQKCFGQLYTVDDEEANALRIGFIKHFTPDKKVSLVQTKSHKHNIKPFINI